MAYPQASSPRHAVGRRFKTWAGRLALALGFALAAVSATPALAGESAFGWLYTLDLQPTGGRAFEQRFWLQRRQSQGTYDFMTLKSEFEYGVSENYQVGFYVNSSYLNAYRNGIDGTTGGPGTDLPSGFDPLSRYRKFRVDSVSFEQVWRITNPYTDPIGFGVYIEPEIGPNTRELEAKLLFQKNFLDDRLIVASNISFVTEREYANQVYERASMIDTQLGVSYRFANNMAAGLEYRNHREYDGYMFNNVQHSAHFLGPNFHYATKDWWLTVAWRHQMPWAKGFTQEQQAAIVNGRIYGDEHARDEFMVRFAIPF